MILSKSADAPRRRNPALIAQLVLKLKATQEHSLLIGGEAIIADKEAKTLAEQVEKAGIEGPAAVPLLFAASSARR
jgi:hypothetical protein